MKVVCKVGAFVYRKLESEYEIDGKKGMTYKLLLDMGENVETFKVSQKIYDEVVSGETYVFDARYDDTSKYAPFALTGVSGKNAGTNKTVSNTAK